MRFGFIGSFGTTDQLLEMAVEAEKGGWDGFFTWDGISVGPVDTYDPWALLGAIAARTSSITLGAMIFPLARRRPWKVAREALTVDHLSHGRLVLPVGLGAVEDGGFSQVSGEPTDRRIRAERLDECLAILELAWRGEQFSYEGRHYQVRDLVFQPRPVQRPRIPVWVVASYPSERSMGRAARWDGVIPALRENPAAPLDAGAVADVTAWVRERRQGGGQYEIVCEGVADGSAASTAHQRALRDAGATWWIESRWQGRDAEPAALLQRIRQGPPELD
jgi:alkanesulfonate monooxygenase SsuD/methylene tetrahydromethanopterin reductase-like flavin-dependent oxidoreductase (luciferase family)